MKRIKQQTLTFLFVFLTSSLFAQMNYWTTPAKKWNMTSSTPTSITLPGGTPTYSVANGAYDESGNLLFYVQDDKIISSTGSFVDYLPNYYPNSSCAEAYEVLSGEIAIVPVPGACSEYYVVYGKDNPTGNTPLLYITVDCSGATPVMNHNGQVYTNCNGYMDQAFKIDNHSGSDNIAFAVSKVYTGTGATAKRFLLSVSYSGIVRSEITSSGISSGSVTASYTNLSLDAFTDFNGVEAEISWGSNKFAWSSDNDKVYIITLSSTGEGSNPALQTYSISGAKGIEFNNSTSTTPYLYVAAASDIKRIYTYNQSITSISWGSNDLSNTFLEYGKNNRIYGVSPIYSGGTLIGSKLVGIISTFVLPGVTADIDSRYIPNTYIEGVFTLPDQIDGEDYSYFNGIPAVSITNFTLNTNIVSNVCDNGTDKYCQNAAIEFNATYSGGTPDEYKIIIEAYHNNTCVPTKLTGAGYIDYQGSWTNGTPTANLDLRTLTDGNGLNLGNIDGTVKITYSIKDDCGKEDTYVRYIQILNPVAPSIALEIYDYTNSQNYLTPSHNIGSPNLVGTSSLGYRINSSTGSISAMTVLIEEVDNTGAFIQTIYNKTTNISDVSGLTYENLNGYCIGSSVWGFNPGFGSCAGGYTGYFSYTNGQLSYQNYYKITVTLSNPCSTSSDWSYFYVGAYSMPINPNAAARNTNQPEENITDDHAALTLYPNPVNNQLTIAFNNEKDNKIEILLTDVLGKQTTVLMPSTNIKTGVFKQTFDVSKLPNGIYTYQIKLSNTIKTGIISKQ